MRALVAISLVVMLVLGCQPRRTSDNMDLERWYSSDASLDQRLDAASRLVLEGTKQVEAERILGKPTRRGRFHGPVVYLPGYEGPTNRTHSDVCFDFYDFNDGDYVCLTFDNEVSRSSRFEDSPLLSISTGNTNRDTLTITPLTKK